MSAFALRTATAAGSASPHGGAGLRISDVKFREGDMSQETATEDHRAVFRDPEIDVAALRARYRLERDRRTRPEGKEQYIEARGDFSHYVDDPYVEPGFARAPFNEQVEVLIVGGGFAGLSVGARLRLAGIEDIRMVEKGGDFGGAWYWNRYPGVQCDTESYIYLPLLEATGYIPTRKYILGAEIFEHARRLGRQFGLYERTHFQTQVTSMRWSEDESLWLITTNHDDAIKARFVVQTTGVMDRPKLPGIPGIDRFKGRTFHTSRWDYAYTGGDITGGLTKLADKRVAVIGTGCTAIQCVPHLGAGAKHLFVFQRTPSSVDERRNSPTDPDWARSLKPGWHEERRQNFVALTSGVHQDVDLVNDGWTDMVRRIGGFYVITDDSMAELSPEEVALRTEMADFEKMNEIRARVDSIVKDKATAEALKPWYRQFCKRPTFSDDYLDTFNRPNVTLVDTDGRGVSAMTEKAVVVNGVEYEVDCVIFATGFETGTTFSRRSGSEIHGVGGKSLSKEWERGLKTLHGFCSHDFPNLFHMGVNQNGVSYLFTYHLDEQAEHIVDVLKRARLKQARRIEPTLEAQTTWVQVIRTMGAGAQDFRRECTPGYYNNEGKVGEFGGVVDEVYAGGPVEFYGMVRNWRAGDMDGLMMY